MYQSSNHSILKFLNLPDRALVHVRLLWHRCPSTHYQVLTHRAALTIPDQPPRQTFLSINLEIHPYFAESVRIPLLSHALCIADGLAKLAAMGFHVPNITTDMPMMEGGLVQTVALPLGPSVPFHIKAPTWRELLKLMARMSETRIEPTVEALAQTKSEPKLRTIVQFIKVRTHLSYFHSL
jgi:hypothetical protein